MKNRLAYMIERSAFYYKDETAVISNGTLYTFEEIHLQSNAFRNGLASLGVKKGERVGVFLPNIAPYVVVDFGLIKGGYVRVPLNSRLALPELEHILNDSETTVLVYFHEYEDEVKQLQSKLNTVEHYICVGAPSGLGGVQYETILETMTSNNDYEATNSDDDFQILYTSGTTGKPKGALTNVLSRINSLNNVFIDEMNIDHSDAILHVASLAHGGGTKVLPHFVKGATNILMDKFDVELFLQYIEKYGVTSTWMVPTMINMLVEHPNIREYNVETLKTIVYAAAPMPVSLLKRAIDIFGNIFVQVYGLSEAPNPDLVLTKNDHLKGLYENPKILGSAGREILNAAVRLVDQDGNEVKIGEVGEIIIKGDNIMTEYWKLPEETAETIKDGWLYTGDLAIKDEEGYVYIVDRSKDMIISGGYNVYPREVEEVLYQHEAILEVAIIGIPDEKWGESVKACVVVRDGFEVTEEEIIKYCELHLASYKKPRSVDFYEELPKNPNGKISKKDIRDQYLQSVSN